MLTVKEDVSSGCTLLKKQGAAWFDGPRKYGPSDTISNDTFKNETCQRTSQYNPGIWVTI